jgi:hypothetical protein
VATNHAVNISSLRSSRVLRLHSTKASSYDNSGSISLRAPFEYAQYHVFVHLLDCHAKCAQHSRVDLITDLQTYERHCSWLALILKYIKWNFRLQNECRWPKSRSFMWVVTSCTMYYYTRKNAQVVTNLQQTCSNAVPTTGVFTLLVPSLLTSCQRLACGYLRSHDCNFRSPLMHEDTRLECRNVGS